MTMDNEPTIEPTRVESKITEAAATKQLTAQSGQEATRCVLRCARCRLRGIDLGLVQHGSLLVARATLTKVVDLPR
jgi:hypothetical protein